MRKEGIEEKEAESMSKQLVKQLLLSDNFWALNKDMVYMLGLETAFLLSSLADAETMLSDNDGWFYQTSETVEEITTLSRHKQDQCIKALEDAGILEKDVRGIPPKRYFRLNYLRLANQFAKFQQINMRKTNKSICEKSATSKESIYKEHTYKEHTNIDSLQGRKKNKNDLDVSSFDTELQPILLDFIEHRKNIKKPMTKRALTLLVNKLEKIASTNDERIAILNESIINGWVGVFPLKNKQTGYKKEMSEAERIMNL